MIDCHAHLAAEEFDGDRALVLGRARQAGVQEILVVSEDLDDARRVLDTCAVHGDALRPCVGLHPDRFAEDRRLPSVDDIAAVEDFARAHGHGLAAIGEVGLDYWWVKSDERRAAQGACLERMAALAAELDLPLNVHSRSAGKYAVELLAACGARRVLMHAFDGRAAVAVRAAESHGFLFSVPPSVVRSPQKQKLVRRLPLESLALEADAPVLGPEPGERNEPANLVLAVQVIAAAHGVSEERVRQVTTENARRLFGGGARLEGARPS